MTFNFSDILSNPQRLLLEAKCYQEAVKIDVVRNAIGTLKDVSEYWVSRKKLPPKPRYHYQYALFSSSGYTSGAQKCAYAHDIYLIPLEKSKYFEPVIESIRAITECKFKKGKELKNLREAVRVALNPDQKRPDSPDGIDALKRTIYQSSVEPFNVFFERCKKIEGALLAMAAGRFPIFLVPNPQRSIVDLTRFFMEPGKNKVQIYWNDEEWYIRAASDNENLFSFDLPTEL